MTRISLSDGTISVLLADPLGTGTLGPAQPYDSSSQISSIAAADFNDDDIVDLAATFSGSVGVLPGLGDAGVGNGTFGPPQLFYGGGGTTRLITGDLNGDEPPPPPSPCATPIP